MRFLFLILVVVLAVYETQSLPEKCYDQIEECHTTNYEEYVKCIRRRQKRSVDCDSPCESDNCIETCNDCDCSSCNYSTCQNSCNSCCSTCCNNYSTCTNNHCCHKTCHAQCRTSGCRSSCRKNCYEKIKDLDENTASNISSSTDNRHNITTIIHLNNVINNTNIVDIPIQLNNTNQQNITLYQGDTTTQTGNQTQQCCVVISPRQCVPQKEPPYFRCFHYRSNQCGEYCTAPIVHKEQQQVCQTVFPGSAPSCRQSVIYIPQPQPRCTYQSTWPYVSCGISRSTSCAGCYSHYVNTYAQDYLNCPSTCYDDGFGIGPYYRQGPVYRPTYTHVPCFTCYGQFGGYGVPYGGYGAPYGGYGSPYGGGYEAPFGGYGAPMGGYGAPMGGYGGQVGGYPSGGLPISPDPGAMPYGSWVPNIENNFAQANNSSLPFDPLISVGPNLANNPAIGDPFRPSRELEIEVEYEPKSDAQAEVTIIKQKESEEAERQKGNEGDKVNLNNSTQLDPLDGKDA